jgi:DNA-binding transcriptional LysR family regulator
MELQKLRYFYIAAKLQHITKAAEQISIAQPALSQAIKSLESELGVPLFEKQGRNIRLTKFGKHLQERLEDILPQIDALPLEIEQLKNSARKTVKLNILAASSFVINAIVKYREMHPEVVFDFEQNGLEYDSDIMITTNGAGEKNDKPCAKRCVKKERIYLAVPRDSAYATQDAISLADVRDESFVMLSSSRLFGAICNKFCSIAGFLPKILFESDSPTAVQNIISTGTGIAFWPEYSWGKMKNKNVMLRPIKEPSCQRDLIIEYYERQPQSEYALDFYNSLLRMI